MFQPKLCNAKDFDSGWFAEYLKLTKEPSVLHRKVWEFAAIVEVLRSRGLLKSGKTGLGFAVGKEPLPGLFASRGVRVLATDQAPSELAHKLWGVDQFCYGLDDLTSGGSLSKSALARLSYRAVDMREIPEDLGTYDFLWSSGSFEHIGGLEAGLDFVVKAMERLKPGGVAVHTSEYNCTSKTRTLESEHLSLYRESDFVRLGERLEAQGYKLLPIDYTQGGQPADLQVAEDSSSMPHLKLRVGEFVTTSILIVVEKR